MKKINVLLILLLAITAPLLHAQDPGSGIYFGAIAGTKYNSFNRHFAADVEPDLYSFSIGAGSAWTKNNYVIGFEFIYSAGQNESNDSQLQYVGFSNMLSFGYNVSRKDTWKIEPNIGIVLNNNQLILQDRANTFSQNLTNNPLSGNLGLNIKVVDKKGLFTGIKVGYILPFVGESEWENKVSETGSGLKDNVGAFYLQLNLGGLLQLN
jgi:hypothetical protein